MLVLRHGTPCDILADLQGAKSTVANRLAATYADNRRPGDHGMQQQLHYHAPGSKAAEAKLRGVTGR
eukprot:2933050-Alexandrium_andersonii.AAC.1